MSDREPSPADSIIDLYDRHAASWARDRGAALGPERRWLDQFLSLVPSGGTVLDLGCGSGEPIAAHLLDNGYRVTGVDSSPSLIAMCRTRFPGADWQVADMRHLSLGRRFDGVLAWNSSFHLRRGDQRAMFAIFAAHVAPGGALMFTSGPREGEAIGTFEGEPLFHDSLSPAEYRRLLVENGFAVHAHVADDPECGDQTVWLARSIR